MLLELYLFSLVLTACVQDCSCTRSTISNDGGTDKPGCVHKDNADSLTYLPSSDCVSAGESGDVHGAFGVQCCSDDILFFAAKTDDLERVLVFRDRGLSLNATKLRKWIRQTRSEEL